MGIMNITMDTGPFRIGQKIKYKQEHCANCPSGTITHIADGQLRVEFPTHVTWLDPHRVETAE